MTRSHAVSQSTSGTKEFYYYYKSFFVIFMFVGACRGRGNTAASLRIAALVLQPIITAALSRLVVAPSLVSLWFSLSLILFKRGVVPRQQHDLHRV